MSKNVVWGQSKTYNAEKLNLSNEPVKLQQYLLGPKQDLLITYNAEKLNLSNELVKLQQYLAVLDK
jgi:hypothetical protein